VALPFDRSAPALDVGCCPGEIVGGVVRGKRHVLRGEAEVSSNSDSTAADLELLHAHMLDLLEQRAAELMLRFPGSDRRIHIWISARGWVRSPLGTQFRMDLAVLCGDGTSEEPEGLHCHEAFLRTCCVTPHPMTDHDLG